MCEICKKELYTVAPLHLKTHGLTMARYRELYPNAIIHSDTIKKHIGIKGLGNKYSLGIPSPFKGKKLVEVVGIERAKEIGRKISVSKIGKSTYCEQRRITMNSPEFKLRCSEFKKRQLREHPEIIAKQSESLRNSFAIGKVKHWATGLTSETDERIRIKTEKGAKTKAGVSKPECGRSGVEHHMFGKTYRELYGEERAKEISRVRSETIQRLIRDPSYISKREKGIHKKPNKKEIKLGEIISSVSNDFKFNGGYELGVSFDGLIPDYWNVNGRKLAIEHLGDYYHGEKMRKHSREEEVKIKTARYAKCGVACLFIWEHELRYPDKVREKVKYFIGE